MGVEWYYQHLYDKVIKQDANMKFLQPIEPLYLEIDTFGIGLGAELLQVREGMNCVCDD